MTQLRKIEFVRLWRFFIGAFRAVVCCYGRPRTFEEVPCDNDPGRRGSPKASQVPLPPTSTPQDQQTGETEEALSVNEVAGNSNRPSSSPADRSAKSLGNGSNPVGDWPQPPAEGSSTSTDNYTITSLLGAGGFGQTVLVSNNASGDIGVAKISLRGNDGCQGEIEALAALRHENIVCLVDVAIHGELEIIITEFCEGGTLESAIEKHSQVAFQDWGNRVAAYCQQLIRAVAFMHARGFVHLDLKAENIVLTADHKTLKLIDFGLSGRPSRVYGRTLAGLCGTPWYMAPEIMDANQYPYSGGKTDVWSLGCVFYHLCTGHALYYEREAEGLELDVLPKCYFECCLYDRPILVTFPPTFNRRLRLTLKSVVLDMLDPIPASRIDIWSLGDISFLEED